MKSASVLGRLTAVVGAALALPHLAACLDHPLKTVEYDASIEDEGGLPLVVNKDVDILFVVDNSGSMGEEQTNLSENFGEFLGVLEAEGVEANYRVGLTTTDNGNPVCQGTGPEAGKLVLSSCQGRLQDFIFQGQTQVDATTACTDFCSQDTHDAFASMSGRFPTKPTATDDDPEPKPRPWIESIEGKTNLPDGVGTTEALQCLGPQGINGCGFESHLESMYKALTRVNRDDEDSYGFLRDGAILSVIFVTDEADCSYNDDHQSVFLPDGDRTFWSLPDEQNTPTSAVCWNAGVQCTGTGTYEECHAVDLDEQGNEVSASAAEDAAVLRPVSRYTSLLQGIEDQKKRNNPTQEVLVSAIAGVPRGYPSSDLVYQDAVGGTPNDPNFQTNFGIGPGCTSAVAEAVPPVRLKEFAEDFLVSADDNNLFSVCDEDYTSALGAIAETIKDQFRPPCMPACVADSDPTTPELDPNCTLEQHEPQRDGTRYQRPPVQPRRLAAPGRRRLLRHARGQRAQRHMPQRRMEPGVRPRAA
jgi:hypothetical protein